MITLNEEIRGDITTYTQTYIHTYKHIQNVAVADIVNLL